MSRLQGEEVWCVDYVAAHELLPSGLRRHMEPLGHGLFTTEILNDAADTLERFDHGGDGAPLFFEPPSLDDHIVNQSAVFSIMTDPEASLADWLAGHPALFRKVVIPPELNWAIRNHLDQANVTERVLFLGLDGLCRWLARYYGDRPTGSAAGLPGTTGSSGAGLPRCPDFTPEAAETGNES